jgi:hypothetical protein
MSIFGSIMSAIFGHGGQNATASPTASPSSPASKSTSAAAPAPATQAQPSSAMSSVDVEAVLTRLACKRRKNSRSRINTSEDHEVRYWATKFGVSAEELKSAVKKVGNSAEAVQKELGK